MRNFLRNLSKNLTSTSSDESFLKFLKKIETLVSKLLSLAMIVVIFVSVVDLCLMLARELLTPPIAFFNTSLIAIFGLFLNVLIALEVLENITAYLKKHVVQLELVIITSLTAVARKIIIFDSKGASGFELIGLGTAIFALAISYWIVRRSNHYYSDDEADDEEP